MKADIQISGGGDDQIAVGGEQQRIAIRLRTRDKGRRDIAAGACAIFDDHLHIERLGKPFCHAAPDRVGNGARRIGDHHGDGPRWPIGLRALCAGRDGEAA